MKTAQVIFDHIYETNYWNGEESRSGRGSSLAATAMLRDRLGSFIEDNGSINFMVDVGCGDANWVRELEMPTYVGLDISEKVIGDLRKKWGPAIFFQADIAEDDIRFERPIDIVLCRDCLVHLSNEHAQKTLEAMKAWHPRYLAITHFPGAEENTGQLSGGWRATNLELEPFNMPQPRRLLNDNPSAGKYLGIWEYSPYTIANEKGEPELVPHWV